MRADVGLHSISPHARHCCVRRQASQILSSFHSCQKHRRKNACARHNWVSKPCSECVTAEHAKNHVEWHRTVNSNQQLVNDVQYNTFTSPCFLVRRSKKACHNQGRAHHATTLRAVSSGLRPRTTESNTRMGMGHRLSHDTPHLPRGLLRSSLHSRGCKPTTTETPTLFHPGRQGGNTQCSCCCRYREKLAPGRWFAWTSRCMNTFPTKALRPRNYHNKRASRSEGRHAAHKKRCPPLGTQGCNDAEGKTQCIVK